MIVEVCASSIASVKNAAQAGQEKLSEVLSHLEESLHGIKIIKAFSAIKDKQEKFKILNDDHFKLFVQNSGAAVPTTWLCPASKIVLSEVTGGSNKIAIRITRHEASCNLCKLLDSPIISTSANVTGEKPMTNMEEILDYFGNNIDYVINDRIGESTKPSRILDLITKKVLRDGG